MNREGIIERIESMRTENRSADLAFYAWRDLSRTDWAPFLKAAFERNPVCIKAVKDLSDGSLIQILTSLPSESIYDGPRLAQPDEVWNYQTGDGLEKAVLLAVVWKKRHPDDPMELIVKPDHIELTLSERTVSFASAKGLNNRLSL
jgi:hypothetical protein